MVTILPLRPPTTSGDVLEANSSGLFAAESADGRFLHRSKFEVPGIWRMSLQGGGEETRALDQPWDGFDWALVRNGIYLISMTPVTAGVDPPQ
jgi:hypothetical protein